MIIKVLRRIKRFFFKKKIVIKLQEAWELFSLDPKSMISSVLSVWRLNRLAKKNKKFVVFYDLYAGHFTYTKSVIEEFSKGNLKFVVLTSDRSHVLLRLNKIRHFFCKDALYIDRKYDFLLSKLKVPLIVTPASHYPKRNLSPETKLAHIFHSPVSMHYVYGDDAFDGYDIFFAVGPHHLQEIRELSLLRNWNEKKVFLSGYPKIDDIKNLFLNTNSHKNQFNKIMFAPSWGKLNVLRSHGKEIIKKLLAHGFEVVLRPHPQSFEFDMDVIFEIREMFLDKIFSIDTSIGFTEIIKVDCLISDWSGVAYEFAFATSKPVVFIDAKGQQKIGSKLNTSISAVPMEDSCRFDVGLVCQPEDVPRMVQEVFEKSSDYWVRKIIKAKDKYLFNDGKSAQEISKQLRSLFLES